LPREGLIGKYTLIYHSDITLLYKGLC